MAATSTEQRVIGRDAEFAQIARFVDDVPSGPAALLIEGEPGIGKTTLWREGVARGLEHSQTVLSCRPGEAESGLPYAALGDLFRDVPEEVLGHLPDPQRWALEVALLRAEREGPPLQQRAVSAAALNVVIELSRTAPVLLAVDDVQWLDPPSARVLRFVIRRLGEEQAGILLTARTGEWETTPLGPDLPLGEGRLHHLPLAPLSLESLDDLLRSRLHAALSGPVLRQLHRIAGGNPFFALEIGRALLQRDAPLEPGQALPVPETLAALLGQRLVRLPRGARRALLVASALSRPTLPLVEAAAGDSEDPASKLQQAAEAGVIELEGERIRFAHPLLASVIYAQASGGELRRLHRRLAGVVGEVEERARHLALAAHGPDEAVAAALEQAARTASVRGAPDAAAVLLEQALRLTPPDATGDIGRRNVDAADQHLAAGDTARARTLLEQAVAASDFGTRRARALLLLSRVRTLEESYASATALLEQALREVEGDLALKAAIERDMVNFLLQVGDLDQALSHARAGLEAAEGSGDPVLLADALGYEIMSEFFAGRGLPTDLVDRAVSLDAQLEQVSLTANPGYMGAPLALAATLKYADRFDEAHTLFETAYRRCVEHGDEGSLPPILFQLGELELWAGDWEAAASCADKGNQIVSRTGQVLSQRLFLTLRALVEAHLGHIDEARSAAKEGRALSERAGDPRFAMRNLKALGFLELSLGHPAGAHDYLESALELESQAGYDPAVLRLLPDEIEALVALSNFGEARRLAEGLQARGRELDRPWALATGTRCLGLVEAASGDVSAALVALERALKEHERFPQPFELARTLLVAGTVERRAKRKREARESLGRALRIFEELGASLWADRARAELARIGGRAPAPLDLTPTEERIAGLVATGYTNREVADSLFMSPRTVESNLTRIYRKLGVGSRRELSRRMRPDPPKLSGSAQT